MSFQKVTAEKIGTENADAEEAQADTKYTMFLERLAPVLTARAADKTGQYNAFRANVLMDSLLAWVASMEMADGNQPLAIEGASHTPVPAPGNGHTPGLGGASATPASEPSPAETLGKRVLAMAGNDADSASLFVETLETILRKNDHPMRLLMQLNEHGETVVQDGGRWVTSTEQEARAAKATYKRLFEQLVLATLGSVPGVNTSDQLAQAKAEVTRLKAAETSAADESTFFGALQTAAGITRNGTESFAEMLKRALDGAQESGLRWTIKDLATNLGIERGTYDNGAAWTDKDFWAYLISEVKRYQQTDGEHGVLIDTLKKVAHGNEAIAQTAGIPFNPAFTPYQQVIWLLRLQERLVAPARVKLINPSTGRLEA